MASSTRGDALLRAALDARVVELGHPLKNGMPNHQSHPPFVLSPHLRHGDFVLADGYSGANELIVMSGHSGSHIDALGHSGCDGRLHGGQAVAGAYANGGQLRFGAIEGVAPLVCRGVLLDVAEDRGLTTVTPERPIDANDLQSLADRAEIEVGDGDCVLVRTGHGRHWDEPQRYLGEQTGLPGITVDAARWLSRRGVVAIGSDTPVVEHMATDELSLPVHIHCLVDAGVHLIENLELEALHATGTHEFLFVCLPLRLTGSTGSPVRPIALLGRTSSRHD